MRHIKTGLICITLVFLVGCTTQQGPAATTSSSAPQTETGLPPPGTDDAAGPSRPVTATEKKLASAVTTPLSDLNIVRASIPSILKKAQEGAYALPTDHSCKALAQEIEELDSVLGADIDAPSTDKTPSLIERGTEATGDVAVNAVRRTTESIIPFRGWIRKLSGAERYAREVSASITAGSLRRSFLKGLRQAYGCPAAVTSTK